MIARVVATCWSERIDSLALQIRHAHEALRVPAPAHFVEARLDLLARPPDAADLAALASAAGGRLLVTCRPGGSGSPAGREDRHRLLSLALASGAAACDVEHDEGALPPETHGALLVLSHHWRVDGPTPAAAEVADRVRAMATAGADVLKLAAPVRSAEAAHDFIRRDDALPAGMGWAPVPLGPAGGWTRILAPRLGLALAYVAGGEPIPGGDLGQVRLADAIGSFDVGRITRATRIFAVFGWPLAATWSPLLHSELFLRSGVDARLVAMPVTTVDEASRLLEELDLAGAAVTMPHKEAIRALAATESSRVARSGVANTLRRVHGRIESDSFDGAAVAEILSEAMPLRGARIVVIGAGGAARAAAVDLVAAGASVTIVARSVDRADALASATGARAASFARLAELPRDILVHATPAGSADQPGLVADAEALDASVVLDMVTTPSETPLVVLARSRGRRVIDGLSMLARQAAAQQAFWLEGSGVMPPAPADVESLLRTLASRND